MKLFAAIDIGSYEVEMKIFQITSGKGIKEIDCVCHRMELGKDVYRDGKMCKEMTDELCRVLNDFVRIMKGYRVDDWRVCATSAVREAGNQLVFLDRVKRHTGLKWKFSQMHHSVLWIINRSHPGKMNSTVSSERNGDRRCRRRQHSDFSV